MNMLRNIRFPFVFMLSISESKRRLFIEVNFCRGNTKELITQDDLRDSQKMIRTGAVVEQKLFSVRYFMYICTT